MPQSKIPTDDSQKKNRNRYNHDVEFTLREFRREDFNTLWSIDRQCFPPGISYSQPELKAYMRRPGSFTVVAEAEMPDGGVTVRPAQKQPIPSTVTLGFIVAEVGNRDVGHIITIDVVPSARRFGIGSHLLASAESRLHAAKCHAVILEVAVNNQAALSFYKRHQYDVLKTIPHYYSDGVDAFVLGKRLTEF